MSTLTQFVSMWVKVATLCVLVFGTVCIVPVSGAKAKIKEPLVPIPPHLKRVPSTLPVESHKHGTELTPDPLKTLLVLASLDGTLTAVDRLSGDKRWVSRDVPMIKVPSATGPTNARSLHFLPDPKTGSLYVMGKKNNLRKLPFTIPQLVAMAPCKNSEGLMYTGRKVDTWLHLNPYTGEKSEMPLHEDSTCPAKGEAVDDDKIHRSCTPTDALPGLSKKPLIIGKSEYTLSMAEGNRKWNVTYNYYPSADMSVQSVQDYDLFHFTSPSSGSILTYDKESGQILWQTEVSSPVIAVYTVDGVSSNLISVPFNPIAPETLERIKSETAQNNKPLLSTTYIGESTYGLYAVPALVDEQVLLMSAEGTRYPALIEGPASTENDTPVNPNSHSSSGSSDVPSTSNNDSTADTEEDYLFFGYYDVPDPKDKPSVQLIGQSEIQIDPAINHGRSGGSLPPGQYNESHLDLPGGFLSPESKNINANSNLEISDPVPLSTPPVTHKVRFPPFPIGKQPITSPAEKPREVKPIKIVFTTAAITVFVTLMVIVLGTLAYRRYRLKRVLTPKKEGKSKVSDSEDDSPVVKRQKKSADGSLTIGKISFYPSSVLGKGCEGTFVYKGKFEDRDVAVKRILPECFAFADREVDLLKESDQHPNVIRYFCTESDPQFRYIALELCEATLSDWIEGKFQCNYLDPITVLREATNGLAHLHSLRIVHRDIKPANVLISMSGSGCHVRTMISDFGLCKKITNGRMSFSRRSGGIPGTDGWIAPEVLKNLERQSSSPSPPHRMSYSVDVFSLGCVYYFVLTNGEHPFGEPFRRQSNIVNGEYNLEKIQSNPQGVYDLITLMISSNANERPPLYDILCHPMFWTKEKILTFFLDVSDRIEKEDEKCALLRRLESDGQKIVRDDWRNHICEEVAMDLRKYRTYKGQSVRDLLRALRNKKNHYRELTPEAQASLGHIPDQFTDYWINRFPELLSYSWLKFECIRHESIFSKYYPKKFSFNSAINGEMDLIELDEICDNDENRLQVRDISPDKSPKIDKNFWRSKSQFKYQQYKRRQQQNTNLRENPHNFTSFATTRYPNSNDFGSPDSEASWRNPVPKDK